MSSRFVVAAVGLVAVACTTESTTNSTTGPTWSGDIAPLVSKHCRTCHTQGGIGTFALDDYAAAKQWGKLALKEIQARRMPPYGVDASGQCGTFRDARWLAQAEIDTFKRWVDGGMPEGAKAAMPKVPVQAGLGSDALEVQLPVAYTPQAKGTTVAPDDDYRCFRVDPKLTQAKYVTAFDVLPGNPAVVHHVIVFSVNPKMVNPLVKDLQKFPNNDTVMKHLDGLEPGRPGWECYGAAGDDVLISGMPVAWAPGTGAVHYPEGAGLLIEPGEELVVQMHYSLGAIADAAQKGKQSDQTKVRLQLADSVKRRAYMVLHDPFLFDTFIGKTPKTLPPGLASTTYEWNAEVPHFNFWIPATAGTTFDLLGVLPHMHKRGRTMKLEIAQGDAPFQCTSWSPAWDFNWQQFYFLQKPVRVDAKSKFKVACTYDTSDTKTPVAAGYGTDNEMCAMGLFLAEPAK